MYSNLLSQTVVQEMWLVTRIKAITQKSVGVFDGLTNPEMRAVRMRDAIRASGLATVTAGNRHGEPETFAQVFERLYNEPL